MKKYVTDYGDLCYVVSYLGNSSIAVIEYADDGSKYSGNVYPALQSKSAFDELVIGFATMEDVQKIDPQGDYYTTQGGMFCSSKHCTMDGYLIQILYEWDNHEYIKYLITEIAMIPL